MNIQQWFTSLKYKSQCGKDGKDICLLAEGEQIWDQPGLLWEGVPKSESSNRDGPCPYQMQLWILYIAETHKYWTSAWICLATSDNWWDNVVTGFLFQYEYFNAVLINERDEDGNFLELGKEFILEPNDHFNNLPVNITLSDVQVPTNMYNKGMWKHFPWQCFMTWGMYVFLECQLMMVSCNAIWFPVVPLKINK